MLSLFGCFLLAVVVLLAILYFLMPGLFLAGNSEKKRHMSKIQGPPGLPFIGMGLTLARLKPEDMIGFITKITAEYPRLTKMWVASIPFVVMQDPEDIEVILGSTKYTMKGLEYKPLLLWLRDGLLVSRGDKWHWRRKMLTPTFHFKILEDNLGSLNSNARLFVRNVLKQKGKPLDVDSYITLCTIDVMSETAMGIKLNAQENESTDYLESVKRVSHLAVERVIRFWLYNDFIFNLTSLGKEFNKHLKILHDFTEKIIIERKSTYVTENHNIITKDENGLGKKRQAFLDSMIEMDLQKPNSFTNRDIQEEVDTFMFEGHDTTSAAILFALFLVGHHPEVQERIQDEMDAIFDRSDRNATIMDLNKMTYLEQVIKETLRLYPSVPYLSRFLTKNVTLGDGKILPRGTNVMILPYLVHRHSKHYKNPEAFNPDRFSSDTSRHAYSYIPFSAGPRNCIGKKFAMMELKILLSTVFRFTKVESVTRKDEFKLLPHLILRPNKPIMIRMTERKPK